MHRSTVRRTEPSGAAIFWTAFLDGPMGGLFGPTEFPFAPQRLFDAPQTEAVHDLTAAEDHVPAVAAWEDAG